MAYTFHEFPHTRNYDSDLREVLAYMKEFEKILESYASTIAELQEAIKDIDGMQSDIAQLKLATADLNVIRSNISDIILALTSLTDRVNDLTIRTDEVYNYVDTQIALVKSRMTSLNALLNNRINVLEFETNFKYELLAKRLEDYYSELLELIEQRMPTNVYNRVAGKRLGFDDNNWHVYEDLRYGGLTNAELSEANISNEDLAALVLDNRDQAINLRKRLKLHYLFSPVTGAKVSHANAISQALGFLTDGLNNTDFAALDLTNDEVVALDLTNMEKFMYNPNRPNPLSGFVKYVSDGSGITNTQYQHLEIES